MTKTILYEGYNLTHGGGTGIAVYTRVPTSVARSLGYGT